MSDSRPQPLLSVILPTYNERETIEQVVNSLLEVLGDTPVEVVVVDDASPDGTGEVVQRLASTEPRVLLRPRPAKLGLSSAVFEGVAQALGQYVCVMDADLSHDPAHVLGMLAKAQQGYDLVIGSRYVPGGGVMSWPLPRRIVSRVATLGARTLLRLPTRDVLSGFMLCRREVLAGLPTHFSARGFKFLIEVLATQPGLTVYEWPITFHDRVGGRSKANVWEGAGLAWLCLRLLGWKGVRWLRRTRAVPG